MTSMQHPLLSEESTFLSYLTEVAAGYCWSVVRYSVLFSTTLQNHLKKGLLHPPRGGRTSTP